MFTHILLQFSYSTRETFTQLGLLLAGLGFLLLMIVTIAATWRIFEKAGQPGYAAIIPIYGTVTLLQMIGKPWWWFLLMCIPFLGVIWAVWSLNLLSKRFGKNEAFTLGMLFLPFIFYPRLAWGTAAFRP